jgi:hypothetical protein
MRYLCKWANTVLFSKTGKKLYQFRNNELVVGNPSTATGSGNEIDFGEYANAPDKELAVIYPDGANRKEKCGLGVIDPTDPSKARLFVESPLLKSNATLSNKAGTFYEVIYGPVTYKGVLYRAGEKFAVDGTVTTFTGSGTVAITFPPDECSDSRKEAFKIAHLQYGDEVTGYHRWDNGGYTQRDGITQTEIGEGVGYMRGKPSSSQQSGG